MSPTMSPAISASGCPGDFRSDNVTGASPEILAALVAANSGTASSYGADALTARVEARLAELFEREVAVFLVATGTAANALALAALAPPWGAIYCHPLAHIAVDECGAPEFYTGGAKLIGLPGQQGKLTAARLEEAVGLATASGVHHAKPAAVSLTQATEWGTAYRPEEIGTLAERGRTQGPQVTAHPRVLQP